MIPAVETSGTKDCSGMFRTWIKAVTDMCFVILLQGPRKHKCHVLTSNHVLPWRHLAILSHLLVDEDVISSCEHPASLWVLQHGVCSEAWNCKTLGTDATHPLKCTNAVAAQRKWWNFTVSPSYVCRVHSFMFNQIGMERVNISKHRIYNKHAQTFCLVLKCWTIVAVCRTFILP